MSTAGRTLYGLLYSNIISPEKPLLKSPFSIGSSLGTESTWFLYAIVRGFDWKRSFTTFRSQCSFHKRSRPSPAASSWWCRPILRRRKIDTLEMILNVNFQGDGLMVERTSRNKRAKRWLRLPRTRTLLCLFGLVEFLFTRKKRPGFIIRPQRSERKAWLSD